MLNETKTFHKMSVYLMIFFIYFLLELEGCYFNRKNMFYSQS